MVLPVLSRSTTCWFRTPRRGRRKGLGAHDLLAGLDLLDEGVLSGARPARRRRCAVRRRGSLFHPLPLGPVLFPVSAVVCRGGQRRAGVGGGPLDDNPRLAGPAAAVTHNGHGCRADPRRSGRRHRFRRRGVSGLRGRPADGRRGAAGRPVAARDALSQKAIAPNGRSARSWSRCRRYSETPDPTSRVPRLLGCGARDGRRGSAAEPRQPAGTARQPATWSVTAADAVSVGWPPLSVAAASVVGLPGLRARSRRLVRSCRLWLRGRCRRQRPRPWCLRQRDCPRWGPVRSLRWWHFGGADRRGGAHGGGGR